MSSRFPTPQTQEQARQQAATYTRLAVIMVLVAVGGFSTLALSNGSVPRVLLGTVALASGTIAATIFWIEAAEPQ